MRVWESNESLIGSMRRIVMDLEILGHRVLRYIQNPLIQNTAEIKALNSLVPESSMIAHAVVQNRSELRTMRAVPELD